MNKDLGFLIVEDELIIAENLKEILKDSGFRNIRIAQNYSQALEFIVQFKPDVVITDIMLSNEASGLDLGLKLNRDFKIPFIYISSNVSEEIVNVAKSTLPAAYLSKPFKKEDLLIAIELLTYQSEQFLRNDFDLVIKEGQFNRSIPYSEIVFFKSDKNYTSINCSSGKPIVCRESLASLLQRLNNIRFIRVHKSYVVNVQHIQKIRNRIIIVGEQEIPLGRTYRDNIKKESFFE